MIDIDLGFNKYFLFTFLSENGHFCRNQWKFRFSYHETLLLVWFLSSQFSAIQLDSSIVLLVQIPQFSKYFFSKILPQFIYFLIYLVSINIFASVSSGLTNLYNCSQCLSLCFEKCVKIWLPFRTRQKVFINFDFCWFKPSLRGRFEKPMALYLLIPFVLSFNTCVSLLKFIIDWNFRLEIQT